MNKSYVLLRMYDKLKNGKFISLNDCCTEYGISVPTFRRYVAFLREYFSEVYAKEIVYDSENMFYILK